MEYDKPKMVQACGGTARMARGFLSSSGVGRSCYEVKLLTTTATATGVHRFESLKAFPVDGLKTRVIVAKRRSQSAKKKVGEIM